MTFDKAGYTLPDSAGQGIWFPGTLMTVKAGGDQTRGGFTLIEQLAPAGFAPPPHLHRGEEEAFYVLEGELTVTCGDRTWTAAPGAFVLLPRGIPHTFAVSDAGPAKLLQITAPAQFERFAAEVGEPARQPTLPPPTPLDLPRMLELMAKYGYEPAGPPPTR
jgi:mannose-6-phosphate isomerase-like protein (cupin superfamily)